MVRQGTRVGSVVMVLASVALVAPGCGSKAAGDDDSDSGASGADGGSSAAKGGTGGIAANAGMGGASSGKGGSGAGKGGSGMAGGTSDPALRTFCDEVQAAHVSLYQRCNGLAAEIAQAFLPVDPCGVWGPAVAGDRMIFDAGADASACVSALQMLACDADTLPAVCDSVLTGKRTIGDSCSFAAEETLFSECEVGDACVGDLLGATGCEGTCVKRGLLGQSCSGSQPCVSGETCSLNSGCVPRGSPGSACGLNSSPICEEGYHCSDLVSGGTCVASIVEGGTCSGQPLECAAGTICDRGADLTGTCRQPLKPGDACTVGKYDCSTGLSHCGSDMKCHRDPIVGEPCLTSDGEQADCLVGYCDTTLATPVCKAVAVGSSCETTADCASGSLCLEGLYPKCSAACY